MREFSLKQENWFETRINFCIDTSDEMCQIVSVEEYEVRTERFSIISIYKIPLFCVLVFFFSSLLIFLFYLHSNCVLLFRRTHFKCAQCAHKTIWLWSDVISWATPTIIIISLETVSFPFHIFHTSHSHTAIQRFEYPKWFFHIRKPPSLHFIRFGYLFFGLLLEHF